MKKTIGYHHGDLPAAVLAAAGLLLKEKGIAKLSVREAAKMAGVSSAAPYRHFKNKTKLLEALAKQGFQQIIQICDDIERKYSDDPRQQLTELGSRYILFATEHAEVMNLMFGGAIDLSRCGESLQRVGCNTIERLSGIIKNGQEAGIYKPMSNFELSLAAWSLSHGVANLITAGLLKEQFKTKKDIKKAFLPLANILLNGMLK